MPTKVSVKVNSSDNSRPDDENPGGSVPAGGQDDMQIPRVIDLSPKDG